MFGRIFSKFLNWMLPPRAEYIATVEPAESANHGLPSLNDHDFSRVSGSVVIYDEMLYERARSQWQFGDWKSLAGIEREDIENHPEKVKIALMVAAGHLQSSNVSAAKAFITMAQDWGGSKKLVARMLIAGVHNSLARAAVASGDQARALRHFENAISTGTPGADLRLMARARSTEQQSQLGLKRDDEA